MKQFAQLFPEGSYLNCFLSEKDIPEQVFDITDSTGTAHSIPNGVVVEHMAQCGGGELASIEDILRQIDFHNGDVNHFFQHLATGLAEQFAQGGC
jgi:hypothetical protein